MPRPKKCRRVCNYPQIPVFVPADMPFSKESIVLTIEEYETIRLIDKEGFSQEECGEFMQIARTTVQQIYANARKKIADMLVDGIPLRIEGGDYRLCSGGNTACKWNDCFREKMKEIHERQKGEHTMRIAVTYENGEIFQHFGHTAQFKIYDIEDGSIVSSDIVDTNGIGHGALAGVLRTLNADVLICGGIGGGAQAALTEAGIQLYGGVSGDADAAVNAFAAGTLSYDPNVHCDHHDHHGEGHTCGNHGCGSHTCG